MWRDLYGGSLFKMAKVFHLVLLLRIHKSYTMSFPYRVRLPTFKYVGLNEFISHDASHIVLLYSTSLIVLPNMLIYKIRKGRREGRVVLHLQHTVAFPCSPLMNCVSYRACNWAREVFPVQQWILIFNNFVRCVQTSSLRTLCYERSIATSKAISPESEILYFILQLPRFSHFLTVTQ
jgi:hypothetical protein